jgi:gamma-glutamylcyclotransferase
MHYFAYGTNLSRAHMHLWCPSARPLVAAALPDHRLAFRCWADIVPSEGDRTPGALYEISPVDLEPLDEYEDFPDLYDRIRVTAETESGPVEAFAYRMRPGHVFAPPAPEYLGLIEQGYRDWGLDPALLPIRTRAGDLAEQ